MLDFREPVLGDGEWIRKLVAVSGREGCEYTFGNIFAWSKLYDTKVARYKDFFIARDSDGGYCFPAGEGDLRGVIAEMRNDAKSRGTGFRMYSVTEKDRDLLKSLYGNSVEICEDRDFFDYIYSVSELAELSGKKYHQKRNHITAFTKEHSWQYEELTEKNIPDCFVMYSKWREENIEKNPEELLKEYAAIKTAFDNYDALGLKGALIRNEYGVIAFTAGEEINSKIFCTHFEKAYSGVRGAYPMINREFAARTLRGYEYVNREEDTGDEGLRKAKLSYHPSKLLIEYTAEFKD